MTSVRVSIALLLAAAALPGCSEVDAEAVDTEVRGLLEAARGELAEGRAALERTLEGEVRTRLEHLIHDLEAAATRLGEGHLDELRELLETERGGLDRALDALESKGAASWRSARGELEEGVDRLSALLERWAAEVDRDAAATVPDPDGEAP